MATITETWQDGDALSELDETGMAIIAAARATFVTHGLRRSTMDDVARAADLGRATVYRRFASKEDLVEAVMQHEFIEYLVVLDQITESVDGFDEQMVEGFVSTLRFLREDSFLRSVLDLDGEWGRNFTAVKFEPIIAAATAYLAGKMRTAQSHGFVPAFEPEPVAELMVRLCHSLMLSPKGVIPYADDDAARSFARSVLVPIVTKV